MTVTAQAARGFSPWVVDITNALGWSQPGFVIMALTAAALIGYAIAYLMLRGSAWSAKEMYYESSGLAAFVWWWIAMALFLVLLAVEIVHTLLLIWFGYTAATQLRDWWHKGAKA